MKGRLQMKKQSSTVKDFFAHLLFVAAFVFVGSGMLEACVLKLMEVIGW